MYLSEIQIGRQLVRPRFISPYLGEAPADALPGFTPAETRALRITTTFETGRPIGFGGLTGDFDGQGLSFGLLQWNFGTGSLQPLLLEFARRQPQRFAAIFGPHAAQLRQVLGQTPAEQLRFARSINDARKRIGPPWSGYFGQLAADPAFQQIQLQQVRQRMNRAIAQTRQLGLRSERGLALLFDNITQNGAAWPQRRNRAALIQQRRAALEQHQGRPASELELLEIIANVVADTVLPRWRENVRHRRMTIVNGRGRVHGRIFDLERDFGLTDQPWEATTAAAALQGGLGQVPVPASGGAAVAARSCAIISDGKCVRCGSCTACERRVRAAVPAALAPVPAALLDNPGRAIQLDARALAAYQRMLQAARDGGIPAPYLKITSGHRDYDQQVRLWRDKLLAVFRRLRCDSAALACLAAAIDTTSRNLRAVPMPHRRGAWGARFLEELRRTGCTPSCNVQAALGQARQGVAPPGASPHHTGRALDLYVGRAPGAETAASTVPAHVDWQRAQAPYQWMVCNAARFDFHPYNVEPWHWEYNPTT